MKRRVLNLTILMTLIFAVCSLSGVLVNAQEEVESTPSVTDLFGEYYNDGVYAKDTNIYIDASKVQEDLAVYFHANRPSYTRTTYYDGDKLWFSYGSGYGTSEDGRLTHFNMVNGEVTGEYKISSLPGMEDYYVTLHDFVEGTHTSEHSKNQTLNLHEGWTYDENTNVYSSNAQGVLEAFRLFVAPTWIGSTEENGNYIDYTLATVEEVGQLLVMKLWVSKTEKGEDENSGKLQDCAEVVGDNAVFAEAVIVKDASSYNIVNGGFEDGLEGWTKVGNIGDVSSDRNYWLNDPESAEGFAFGMDGEKMFSAYAPGALETAVGTLTSSTFTVGGSGYVTFKVGAMRDGNYVYIDVVDANTKEILSRYYNGLWADRTDGIKSGCTLVAYKADLSEFKGKEVFFRISDNADSGYGLFFVDSFNTYYPSEPLGFNVATPVDYEVSGTIYDVFNGGFEMGDNQGWWNVGEPGKVTSADAFFSGVDYGKDGKYLYSGVEDFKAGNGREGNMGVLTSSVFEIGGSGYITYMLGGGNGLCYVQIIDSTTGETLARYRQQEREDAVLKTYVADLRQYIGRTVRIQVVDNATYDWGCISFDNVVAYHLTKPDGIEAIDVKNQIINGSFEENEYGWRMDITEHGAHGRLGWVESSEHNAGWYTKNDDRKDGNNLFTFCKPDGTNCENTKGTLNSSVFTLNKDSYVSFRFGGAGTRDVCVQLVNANGEVIATFFNEAPGKANTEMYAYYYKYTGETADCYFRVVDNSVSNYGCFVVDDFRVNLATAPEGFIAAIQ